MPDAVFQLKCYCNELPWGKKGSDSLAARLCAKTPGTDFRIEDGRCYSEMYDKSFRFTFHHIFSENTAER